MTKSPKPLIIPSTDGLVEGQCHFYVLRKKRFCRMTVRPGRNYCGEHEPKPKTTDGENDKRIPCPLDSKHTCYSSKLEKHLSICNARVGEPAPYLVQNVNAPPPPAGHRPRRLLADVTREEIQRVVEKINKLYEEHIKENITVVPTQPIHASVLPEFSESNRTESSLRHLRQVSSLLHIAEDSGLVEDNTCYVELGAGKGQLSYYVGVSWCQERSRVVSVDRAALRHKRDNRLRSPRDVTGSKPRDVTGDMQAVRLRADLAHVALERVPAVEACDRVVGFAKHLCGVATDYALRCVTSSCRSRGSRGSRGGGAVLAGCCHHRCERPAYVANTHLQDLDISAEDFNIMLGVVSWATCGDGRSRELRDSERVIDPGAPEDGDADISVRLQRRPYREQVGRKAKLIIDWGRVLYLRENGFDARLCYYVDTTVSLENVCIVAKKL